MFVETAPAKLNLALHVRARRSDGYHDLETLFAFVTDGDVLRVMPADAPSFGITGPFAAGLDGTADNLVTRARDAFDRHVAPLPTLAIELDKHLPVASGIGGGSADAAAMLRIAARIARRDPHDPRVVQVAADLGADVPACLLGRTTIGVGRGEALREIAGLRGRRVLLVNPGIAVSTGPVFASWDGVDRGALLVGDDAWAIAVAGRNDLTAPARHLAPVIGDVLDVLEALPNARLVRMSGSGATCFALFDDAGAAQAGAERIRRDRPGWWCLETALA